MQLYMGQRRQQCLQMRLVSGQALRELQVVLLIRFKLMKQSQRQGAVSKLQARAVQGGNLVKHQIGLALSWFVHATSVFETLQQTKGLEFVRATVPSWPTVESWLQREWLRANCLHARSLDDAVNAAYQALMGPAGAPPTCSFALISPALLSKRLWQSLPATCSPVWCAAQDMSISFQTSACR